MITNDLVTGYIASSPAAGRGPGSESLRIDEHVKVMVLNRLNRLKTRTATAESLGIGIAKLEGYMRQFNIYQEEDRGRFYIKEKKLYTI